MGTSQDIVILSATRVGMLMRCPRQYEFRYIQGLVRPPGAALVLGRAFHKAMADLAMERADGAEMEQDQAADLFVDAFDAEAEGEVDWGEEKPGQIKDIGTKMANRSGDLGSAFASLGHCGGRGKIRCTDTGLR